MFYIDHSGNTVLEPPDFQSAGSFVSGLAPVSSDTNQVGFIDKSGVVVIEPQFKYAGHFCEGLSRVLFAVESKHRYWEKWGFIDKTGQLIIETDYEHLCSFSEGIAVGVKQDKFFFLDKTGKETFSFSGDDFEIDHWSDTKFSHGLIVVCDSRTGKCGFMDRNGKLVIEPKFNNAANFSEGLARVAIIENDKEYLGFINLEGEFEIDPKFDIDWDFRRNATDFSEGLASLIDGPLMMEKEQSFIFINKAGEIVLHTDFFRAEPFHEGLSVVWDHQTDRCGYIDKTGEVAIPVKFCQANDFSEGLAYVRLTYNI